MERRTFLKRFLETILFISSALLFSYPVFAFLSFRKISRRQVVFKKGEGAEGIEFKDGVFLVPVDGKLLALSARCTHLGCTVNYDQVAQQFRCPCHGSRFDRSGRRIAGPARKPLQELPIKKKSNGDVEVTITF
jgi:cytochrome b6-f complex iron-sulfur subunit